MRAVATDLCACVWTAVVSAEHPELGLEERRQRRLSGGTQARIHRSELSRARILHAHGQPLHDEIIQGGERVFVTDISDKAVCRYCRLLQ